MQEAFLCHSRKCSASGILLFRKDSRPGESPRMTGQAGMTAFIGSAENFFNLFTFHCLLRDPFENPSFATEVERKEF